MLVCSNVWNVKDGRRCGKTVNLDYTRRLYAWSRNGSSSHSRRPSIPWFFQRFKSTWNCFLNLCIFMTSLVIYQMWYEIKSTTSTRVFAPITSMTTTTTFAVFASHTFQYFAQFSSTCLVKFPNTCTRHRALGVVRGIDFHTRVGAVERSFPVDESSQV